MTLKIRLTFVLATIFSLQFLFSQEAKYEAYAIGFYNLENLFDTVNDTTIWDEEFLPEGAKTWTPEKYNIKLANMARVIDEMGKKVTPEGVSVLGVSEIENITVLEDLIRQPLLKDKDWGIVHYDSPDFRGIDVGLLYRKDQFTVLDSENIPLHIYDGDKRIYTRDVLHVSGTLAGETFHILVNHWPSRRGGEKKSSPNREAGAALNKKIVDSLYQVNPSAKIIIMGDLNDNPDNKSVAKVLNAKKKKSKVKPGGLYNPMRKLYDDGYGSNAYRDAWSLFDQIIVSHNTLDKQQEGLFFYKIEIFRRDYLIQADGHFKNYPFRTYAGSTFMGGYSDHFPVVSYFLKKLD